MWHKWWDGSGWGPSLTRWQSLGGRPAAAPSAVAWGPDRLDVFYVGQDGGARHKWWNGSAWGPSLSRWESLGGQISGGIRAVAWGTDRLDLFARSAIGTRSVVHKWWDGSRWGPSITGWEELTIDAGYAEYGFPDAVAWGPDRLDIIVPRKRAGELGVVVHTWWDGAWPVR